MAISSDQGALSEALPIPVEILSKNWTVLMASTYQMVPTLVTCKIAYLVPNTMFFLGFSCGIAGADKQKWEDRNLESS
jgi:hypothetical protein